MGKKHFYDGLGDELRAILLSQIRNLWSHSSTALEGNSLTLGETAFVLEEGLTIAGKPLRDHQEVVGHARAIELVYGLLDRDAIGEEDVFLLHQAVLTDRTADIHRPAGAWKKEANFTSAIGSDGRQFIREYPSPSRVPALMAEWLTRFNHFYRIGGMPWDDAVKCYASLHLSFVAIHPFFDGNGRMARLLSNLPVLRAGHPPIVVPTSLRREYLDSISGYQNTVPGLADLSALEQLPENDASRQFAALCRDFARETVALVDNAFALQKDLTKDGIC